MREPPLAAGNWKMNPPTLEECVALARGVRDATRELRGVEIAVAPPFVALAAVRDALAGSHVRVSGQDVHEEERGAFTAGVSAAMLRELASLVIVGHSETRRDHGLTEARVNAKLRRALAAGLAPILCVGETLDVRRAGAAEDYVRRQVRADVEGVSAGDLLRGVIAYEPIWAIGTGVPATGPDARATIAAIRAELRALYGDGVAERVRVLYGGSVTAETIGEFASQPGIDGALVGGASLRADEFARIARVVAESRAGPRARARGAPGGTE